MDLTPQVYTGYTTMQLTDEELSLFYQDQLSLPPLKENEYLIIEDAEGVPVDYYCNHNGLVKVTFPTLGNDVIGKIKPRNPQQYCAMDLLKNADVPLKLIMGKPGSGKSMMCIIAALEAVQKGRFDKIVFIRNNVQVSGTDPLGALPGDQQDKILPYLMPFADHCGGIDGLLHLIDNGQLEAIPLAFLRGRSIRNSIIYSMESENLTKQHIQLIMCRADEGSELWLDGDTKQRDKVIFEQSRGIEAMINKLAGNKIFGYIHLIKTERSEIAQLADLLD